MRIWKRKKIKSINLMELKKKKSKRLNDITVKIQKEY